MEKKSCEPTALPHAFPPNFCRTAAVFSKNYAALRKPEIRKSTKLPCNNAFGSRRKIYIVKLKICFF
jgi:hypothetical protein